jgi:hypothetical protein
LRHITIRFYYLFEKVRVYSMKWKRSMTISSSSPSQFHLNDKRKIANTNYSWVDLLIERNQAVVAVEWIG